MDYSKSVYVPEVSLEQAKDGAISQSKADLLKRVGMQEQGATSKSKDECVLVQMTRQLKEHQKTIADLQAQIQKLQSGQGAANQKLIDSPAAPSNAGPATDNGSSKFKTAGAQGTIDGIDNDLQDEIVDEVDDLIYNDPATKKMDALTSSNDPAMVSGGVSSSGANAIDQSIDTLQLDQYDYVEPVLLNNP